MNFYINEDSSILNALKKINNNSKGFVIIINEKEKVVGTITDGDIRRFLIDGNSILDTVKTIMNVNFEYINETDDFEIVVEKFKNNKINFLPILNSEKRCINVITKKQLHLLLLEGKEWSPFINFTNLKEALLEQEIYNRPWGYYKTVFLNDFARAKIILVNPKGKLSLQEHKLREEHWVIIKGLGEVTIGDSIKHIKSGNYIFIPKSCKHTIENISENEPLIISEVQLGTYFGEDDIIRYSDIYGRD